MENKDIDFVARHYRHGRFSTDSGWRRLGISSSSGFWRRYRIAAAVAALVVLTATAAIIYHEYNADTAPRPAVEASAVGSLEQIKVIDFENAPLARVVEKIETVYNVRVENLPVDPDDYELSLHYEGTPTDLVDAINDILGTQMSVVEK